MTCLLFVLCFMLTAGRGPLRQPDTFKTTTTTSVAIRTEWIQAAVLVEGV